MIEQFKATFRGVGNEQFVFIDNQYSQAVFREACSTAEMQDNMAELERLMKYTVESEVRRLDFVIGEAGRREEEEQFRSDHDRFR